MLLTEKSSYKMHSCMGVNMGNLWRFAYSVVVLRLFYFGGVCAAFISVNSYFGGKIAFWVIALLGVL